ncbi:MAG TPA: hypothetical protein VJB02_04930 [Coxiellaceae bacterium]|nr:hypothetical protein [Coxiellaceae bacterium]
MPHIARLFHQQGLRGKQYRSIRAFVTGLTEQSDSQSFFYLLVLLELMSKGDFAYFVGCKEFFKELPGLEGLSDRFRRFESIAKRLYTPIDLTSAVSPRSWKSAPILNVLFQELEIELEATYHFLKSIYELQLVRKYKKLLSELLIMSAEEQNLNTIYQQHGINSPLKETLQAEFLNHRDTFERLFPSMTLQEIVKNARFFTACKRAIERKSIQALCEQARQGKLIRGGPNGPISMNTWLFILGTAITLFYSLVISYLPKTDLFLQKIATGFWLHLLIILFSFIPGIIIFVSSWYARGKLIRYYDSKQEYYKDALAQQSFLYASLLDPTKFVRLLRPGLFSNQPLPVEHPAIRRLSIPPRRYSLKKNLALTKA